jgi:hypothetical protein
MGIIYLHCNKLNILFSCDKKEKPAGCFANHNYLTFIKIKN